MKHPERLWVEPLAHLVIHGAELNSMARFAYDNQRHDKCVPYVPESALAKAVAAARAEAFEQIALKLHQWCVRFDSEEKKQVAEFSDMARRYCVQEMNAARPPVRGEGGT